MCLKRSPFQSLCSLWAFMAAWVWNSPLASWGVTPASGRLKDPLSQAGPGRAGGTRCGFCLQRTACQG